MRTLEERCMEDARSGHPCIRCHAQEGVCGRHYNGLRQHRLGKGRGIKAHPFAVADFCEACDKEFQEGTVSKADLQARDEYSEEFLFYCLLTLIRRAENEIIR